MSTNPALSEADKEERRLSDLILKGESDQAAQSARQLLVHQRDANDVVDTISDAMNIAADLHEVEAYSNERIEGCERAAERALEAIRPEIRVEQTRISGRVMVTSLKGDPHNFDRTILLAMLEIGGFTPLDGGGDLTPAEAAAKASLLHPDILAVPLVTAAAAKNLLETNLLIKPRMSKLRVVAYGRGTKELAGHSGFEAVEENSLSALSRITELLVTKNIG
jgi:methanogenic corrinoid protein MtbC1